tara:strand:- start:31 stop:240 length:210 start_codon:yes stop_codon:yes gene_type:complete
MKKIFKWFYRPKQKGEDKMSKKIEEQVQRLNSRISNMSDKVSTMENDINRFKKQVAEDMKTLVKLVQNK